MSRSNKSPTPLRSDGRNNKRSPRLLGTLWWSEKSGGLFHRETRKVAPKWLGLTKGEWGFFGCVVGVAFVAGLAVLRMAPELLPM